MKAATTKFCGFLVTLLILNSSTLAAETETGNIFANLYGRKRMFPAFRALAKKKKI
jgi:hypothetical protein